jgi:hypothetical protein
VIVSASIVEVLDHVPPPVAEPIATSGFPAPTATHSAPETQEIESKEPLALICHEEPLRGLPLSTSPLASTATHSEALTQEMPLIADPPATLTLWGEVQESCAAAPAFADAIKHAAAIRAKGSQSAG